jgi:hypothetical protein
MDAVGLVQHQSGAFDRTCLHPRHLLTLEESCTVWELDNTRYGGTLETRHQVICLFHPGTAPHFDMPLTTVSQPLGIHEALTPDAQRGMVRQALQLMKALNCDLSATAGDKYSSPPVIKRVKLRSATQPTHGYLVYDPCAPAPSIAQPNTAMEDFLQGQFGIWTISQDHSQALLSTNWEDSLRRLCAAPGKEGLSTLFDSLLHAEVASNKQAVHSYTSPAMAPAFQATITLNEATAYPLPTEEDWSEATAADHDLAILDNALANAVPVAKAELTETAYYDEWKGNRLELDHGIIYRYEITQRTLIRQLRVKVVPPTLRRVVLAACHASQMAGHSSVNCTYHHVICFWWPYVNRGVHRGVLGCACCQMANHTDHDNQMLLQLFVCDEPLSVVFLDVWQPGEIFS